MAQSASLPSWRSSRIVVAPPPPVTLRLPAPRIVRLPIPLGRFSTIFADDQWHVPAGILICVVAAVTALSAARTSLSEHDAAVMTSAATGLASTQKMSPARYFTYVIHVAPL